MSVPSVLVRVLKRPRALRGDLIVVFVDQRTDADPDALYYSVTREHWGTDVHRTLMLNTRRGTIEEQAIAKDALLWLGEPTVRILQAAPQRSIPDE